MDPALPLAVGAWLRAGVVVVALLAAAAVLLRSPRGQALAMAGALLVAPALLLARVWDTPQFAPARERPLLAALAVLVGLVLLAGAAVAIHRRPTVLPVAALAAIPFRVPIESGGATANLLVPLYFVVGAGTLAFLIERLRRGDPQAAQAERRREEEGRWRRALMAGHHEPEKPETWDEPRPSAGPADADLQAPAGGGWVARIPRAGPMEWLLVGLVVLFAAQSLYSVFFAKALEQVVFFYVPFALLFALLVRVEWTPRLLARCLGVTLGLALVFCLIGFVEFGRRELLLNPQVVASNQFQSYFRVNSLFFDPNIFGRFLVMVMLVVAAVMVWARRGRDVWGAGTALVILWGGLVLTLSQSSLGAMLLGLGVLGGLRWSAWRAALVALVLVAAGSVVVFAAPEALRLKLDSERSVQRATSGRGELIAGGVQLFARRPLTGWGSGAFEPQYRRQERVSGERAVSASHTIPITFAAEQGVVGLAVYLALLALALLRLLRRARGAPARAAIAAAFAALVFHTWLYAAFLEDPLAWTLLAIGSALAWQARPEPERHPAEELRG